MKKITNGISHDIYLDENGEFGETLKIVKLPKPDPEIEIRVMKFSRAVESLICVENDFTDYCPNTEIKQDGDSYRIVQDYVEGKTLIEIGEKNISDDVLNELGLFLERVEKIFKEGRAADYLGRQVERESNKQASLHERKTRFPAKRIDSDNKIIDFLFELKYWLGYWSHHRNIFESSNLMVSKNDELKYIDNVYDNFDQKWKIYSLGNFVRIGLIKMHKARVKGILLKRKLTSFMK